ncbi:hypothetical protein TESG_07262 [Trichophyton tonsurans CBS 112818]|uniref:DUF2293 domain-containing protein n=1 Tax=Trichophyton tonsurans (strain CBS 112818) TaxID=647933 RepID=F2S8N3_TRIT1|nr:hypothetical protein TESG_07262 [Trichophyton tonsurans CBS 112818]
MGKPQRQQRQSRAKRGAGGIRKGASKRAKDMPKALKDKLRDIAYSKTAHGFVPEDVRWPLAYLTAVLNHAFLKGSRRVGRSGKVASEKDKVGLAVEAHIRHVHTEYDDMIRRGLTRERARENIWDEVVILRDSWRK